MADKDGPCDQVIGQRNSWGAGGYAENNSQATRNSFLIPLPGAAEQRTNGHLYMYLLNQGGIGTFNVFTGEILTSQEDSCRCELMSPSFRRTLA